VLSRCHAGASLKFHVGTLQTRIRRLRDNGPFLSPRNR